MSWVGSCWLLMLSLFWRAKSKLKLCVTRSIFWSTMKLLTRPSKKIAVTHALAVILDSSLHGLGQTLCTIALEKHVIGLLCNFGPPKKFLNNLHTSNTPIFCLSRCVIYEMWLCCGQAAHDTPKFLCFVLLCWVLCMTSQRIHLSDGLASTSWQCYNLSCEP